MVQVSQTFEGGTAGATLSTSVPNSSSGSTITLVSRGGSATTTLSTTGVAHGTLGAQVVCSGGTDSYRIRWDFTTNAGGLCSYRFYFTLQSLPSQAQDLTFLFSASGAAAKVGLSVGNGLRLTNLTGAQIGATSAALSAGTTYRIEVQAKKGTGTTDGQLAMQAFVGDSATNFYSVSSTTTNTGTNDFSQFHFGEATAGRTINVTYDDLLLDNTTQAPLGSVATTYTSSPPDPVGITDATTMARGQTQSDPVGITDAATVNVNYDVTIGDTVGIADLDLDQTVDDREFFDEPVGLTDSAATALDSSQSASDAVGITDGVDILTDFGPAVGDSEGLTDSLTVVLGTVYPVTISDSVGIGDAGANQTIDDRETLDDPVGLTDSVSVQVGQVVTVSDPVGLSDSAANTLVGSNSPNDPEPISDTAAVTLSAGRSNDDPVAISDTVLAQLSRVVTVSDLLALTDATTTPVGVDSVWGDAEAIGDAATVALDASRSASDLMGLTDGAVAVLERVLTCDTADALGITDQLLAEVVGAGDGAPVRNPLSTLTAATSRATLTTPTSRGILT